MSSKAQRSFPEMSTEDLADDDEVLIEPNRTDWFSSKPPVNPLDQEPAPMDLEKTTAAAIGYKSTILQRFSSTDDSNIKLDALADILDRELNGTREWGLETLVQDVFPDSALPYKMDIQDGSFLDVLTKAKIVSQGSDKRYRFVERYEPSEKSVAEFMNKIAIKLHTEFRRLQENGQRNYPRLKRLWSTDYYNTVLSGSSIRRKPDIVLVDADHNPDFNTLSEPMRNQLPITWRHVKAVAEVTKRDKFYRGLKNAIDAKSYIMFLTQHDRTFSQQYSRIYTIDSGRLTDIYTFLRIIIGFMFTDNWVIGLDSTMTRNSDQEVSAIDVRDSHTNKTTTCHVVKFLYSAQSFMGRGTKVWEVEVNGIRYILKDSWIILKRSDEAEILRSLDGIKNIPTLFAGGPVMHPELQTLLQTSIIRMGSYGVDSGTRQRRRVLMTPKAEPLSSFSSRLEVCVVFRDIVQASLDIKRKGYVHRDISPSNIMIHARARDGVQLGEAEEPVTRRGLLGNFDYAAPIDTQHGGSFGGRTGTTPFMALSILSHNGKDVVHTPQHDLESVVYAFLYVCIRYAGPGNTFLSTVESESVPYLDWPSDLKYQRLAQLKHGQLAASDEYILKYFTPFFDVLKPLAKMMLSQLFPHESLLQFAPQPQLTHTTLLGMLDDTIRQLRKGGDNLPMKLLFVSVPPVVRQSSGPRHPKKRSASENLRNADKRSRTSESLSTDASLISLDLSEADESIGSGWSSGLVSSG